MSSNQKGEPALPAPRRWSVWYDPCCGDRLALPEDQVTVPLRQALESAGVTIVLAVATTRRQAVRQAFASATHYH